MSIRRFAIVSVILAGGFGLLVAACRESATGDAPSPADSASAAVAPARAFYASQPRFLRPIPYSPVPDGLPDLRASTCGECHEDIYREWAISTHARAWLDDAQYLEELKKTTAQPGRDASWICMNCHTPMESQLPRLVAGLEGGNRGRPIYVDNPFFDHALQDEAITCATCHIQDGVVLGPWGDTDAPHPVRKSNLLMSADLCLQCHEAQATLDDIELACVFDTGTSYGTGPWAAEGKPCQHCHMPAVERTIVDEDGYPVRKTRRHWFGGSRIPKHPRFAEELEVMRDAYPDGARIEWVDLPSNIAAGKPAQLTFAVTNANAGHTLPTGDVERFILVTARVRDVAGRVITERTERFGTHFQWNPVVVKLSDNRLQQQETRAFAVSFNAPAKGPLSLELTGENHRISPENFAYHNLEGRYVAGRVFFTQTVTRPVK
jgi:hypothetical protein